MVRSVISGTCQDRFAAVRHAFETNFAECGEVGASLCLTVDGETVVDLWGGVTAGGDGTPWEPDTLVTVFSSTKGATALAAHTLVDRGRLDLAAPVGDLWPAFATAGKETATVRMMLDHTVGVPAWRERLEKGEIYDWDRMVARCEAEPAFWEPGTRQGYHMMSFGWLVGELVRRVDGRSLGTFIRQEVCEPAGADFWLGLPESEEHRVTKVIPYNPDPANPSAFTRALRADRGGIGALALLNQGGFNPNSRAAHAAEIGGGGGVSSARGLAHLYRRFATGEAAGPDTLAAMATVTAATECDATLGLATRFSPGFMCSMDNRRRPAGLDTDSAVLSATAFGHVGAGGSIGFADPAERLSMGYVMNRMGPGILLNERGQRLVDAVYTCLGYRSATSGAWRR